MDLVKLVERIRKEHLNIQNDRKLIYQLNLDVNEEIDSTIKSMWIIKNQRYICDKLHVVGHNSTTNDPINLINESNKIQQLDFVMGFQKFGSNELFLCQLLQYLKDNPKSISYLLFYAEKECSNFIDLLCKIIFSTIYNNCFLDQDKLSLIDMMEELIEIYINFHDDLRRHLHNKNSSFGIVYRYFCDELLELKSFLKLALIKPIMMVLSEDNLFLDIDSNRAVLRFCQDERNKHFGIPNTPEYKENLTKYQKWTIQKLKYFVSHFIKSLKENIYAFPQSLVLLMIRMYGKLIERFDDQKVNAIFIDMIFFFLLCPAIQNPDLFGITDLHINHIAHYNLMQCAQIIQMLALSNWQKVNMPYQEVCNLFDRNCLTFIIDHIFTVAKNTVPRSIELMQLPHFLISDVELKFLLEFIGLFLKQNDQSDNPLDTYYRKLPESVLNFGYENDQRKQASLKSDQLLVSGRMKKAKSNDFTDILDEFSSLNIKHLLANNSDWPTLKVLFNSKQIFKICNQNFEMKMIGMKSEEKILNSLTDKQIVLNETFDKILEEIDELFNLEINLQSPIDHGQQSNNGNSNLNSSFFMNSGCLDKNNDLTSGGGTEQVIDADESLIDAEMNMQSLGTLTLHMGDFIMDDTHIDVINHLTKEDSTQQKTESKNNPMSMKVLSSFKNIKDKMKNISLKDSKPNKEIVIGSTNLHQTQNVTEDPFKMKLIDLETVQAETDEIFGKYRSSKNPSNAIVSNINLLDELFDNEQHSTIIDYLFDIRNKLRKLFCTMDISYVYQRYRFLNLTNKNDFLMFLKILLSQLDDTKEMSTAVLIREIIRILQDRSPEEFTDIFKQIEVEWKTRNVFTIYLLKSRQHLLQKLEQLKSVQQYLRKEHSATDFIIVSFLVRMILENRESNIQELIRKFRDPSTLTDEKASLVKTLLCSTMNDLPSTKNLTDEQITLVRQILERNLMNRMYLYAFYPNGDIDNMRDQILQKQINHLSSNITHNCKLLNIPSKYYTTSPWPSAQEELLLLSAYKTPRDKVQCIYRCCSHIITLLGTSQNSIPSADDLLPVLIFVVIKSNVRSILSTMQYVNTFYLNEMTGEESYYWTQFCSAVEFIKTILNEQQI